MPEQPPSGWFPDPFGRHEHRYWDGGQWTEHVASRGRQDVDPPEQQAAPAVATAPSPANWYPDPYGRHDVRYWDGSQWTQHVASQGRQAVDPPGARPPAQLMSAVGRAVHQQQRLPETANSAQVRESALFAAQLLVVNQKAKIFGSNVEYAVRDEHGNKLGAVQEVGRGLIRKHHDKSYQRNDETRRYKLQIVDPDGHILLAITRPQTRRGRSTMNVTSTNGTQIGQVVEEGVGLAESVAGIVHAGLHGWSDRLDAAVQGLDRGNARFRLESGDQTVGSIHAEHFDGWDFSIQDTTGTEIARITKSWAGWAKEKFTNADNYVVQIHQQLEDPVHSLVIAAALAVDIALKQREPGLSMYSR